MIPKQTKLKICGITSLEDARFAAGALADYLGFIFYPESPRHVTPRVAAEIAGWIEGIGLVGVFVNQAPDEINAVAERVGLDLVQLHGDEIPDDARSISKPVIKAFRIEEGETADSVQERIAPWRGVASYFLFDAYHSKRYGGTGKSWNWSVLSGLNSDTPFFLAGGISSDNVADAVSVAQPYAVDLSSSLEQSPGVKDFDKMQEFFDRWQELSAS
ncbi:phosphoribosylanthranilate isomerase [Balneolales bacterium ANBcel1]|nr:phosphoribosylanthranilate isomerase [Balneolales bacterium ANBcel1]